MCNTDDDEDAAANRGYKTDSHNDNDDGIVINNVKNDSVHQGI